MATQTEDLFKTGIPIHKRYLPKIEQISSDPVLANVWDIPYTIPQLAYLTHPHFRYYGKFPSVVAGQLLEQYPPPTDAHYMLDNFCGSGTSLVEAKLRGIRSFGLDISWLAVLASRVKTTFLDTDEVLSELTRLSRQFAVSAKPHVPEGSIVEKWFDSEIAADLELLRQILHGLPNSPIKEFLVLGFLAILRRVSKAFDGEVRPHINKKKKQRDVWPAFAKKIKDMVAGHAEYMSLAASNTQAECFLGDNRQMPDTFNDGNCYLVISHPPYLNSFDYTPVYKIEYFWGQQFEYLVEGAADFERKGAELRAHPANEKITNDYYQHLDACYRETHRIQPDSGFLAVVIGDCTRFKVLEPVIDKCIAMIESIGYRLIEANYRTTHYGLGKYAYNHRADYHGDTEKRDGIIVFQK